MYYYRLFGLRISSDLYFRQLVADDALGASDSGVADVFVRCSEIDAELLAKPENVHYEFGNQYSWLKNTTCWLMVENGDTIRYFMNEGMNEEYLKTYILGWGMSMLGLQRGTLAIHCSAIADDKGALLICGESGAGKSTVTTELLEHGYRLLADDMSFVTVHDGRAYAAPAFPYQKLCRDAAMAKGLPLEELIYIDEDKDKFLVPYKNPFLLEPVPIKGMIMLGFTGEDHVEGKEIKGIGQLQMVAENLFLRHLLKKDKYRPEIGQLCLNVAGLVPMKLVMRPHEGNSLAGVMSEINAFVE